MNTKKNILFLVPDGVGIRNYLYSNLIKNLKEESNISIWSPLPKKAFTEIEEIHNIKLSYNNLKLIPENLVTRLFREAATYARLKYNSILKNNDTILVNWRKDRKNFKLRQLYNVAEIIGNLAYKKYNRIQKLESFSINNINKGLINNYKKQLKKQNIDKIFITHQRVASLMPICIAAQELGIEVISVIYSWDNMPKARLSIRANKYLVWSEYMKSEFKDYYPEINLDNVIVTGTPQFEFYNQPEFKITREGFSSKYNLNPSQNWICYSGDDTLTSPNDQFYLEDLAKTIIELNLEDKYHIVFRRCPADFSDRFDKVLGQYKHLITPIDPDWYSSKIGWSANYPRYNDVSLLVNIVYHCDFVVNVGSTMAHDFAMYNKPCAYINYDKPNYNKWTSKIVYQYQHFRTIYRLNPVEWINNVDDYKKIFAENSNNNEDRIKWLNIIVNEPNNASNKIAKILLK